ncbi:hypothetical protein H8959_011372 [Pygathrix nigripes]
MALVTLQRSPTPSAASSSASNSELEAGSEEDRKLNLSLSESFFMVKGAALFLQQGSSPQGQRSLQHPHKHAAEETSIVGDIAEFAGLRNSGEHRFAMTNAGRGSDALS